jgi:hypothetical protein
VKSIQLAIQIALHRDLGATPSELLLHRNLTNNILVSENLELEPAKYSKLGLGFQAKRSLRDDVQHTDIPHDQNTIQNYPQP